MGPTEVFNALGGGVAGLLGASVLALFTMLSLQMRARLGDRDKSLERLEADIKELKDERRESQATIRDLTAAVNRQTDVILSWTPQAQRRAGRS